MSSSISSAASCARAIRPSSSASSVVVKRMALASVWRWMKVSRQGASSSFWPWAAGTSTKKPSTPLCLIFNDRTSVSSMRRACKAATTARVSRPRDRSSSSVPS
ncbi:hypothetical protein D3C87_1579960 [compost metagenome]